MRHSPIVRPFNLGLCAAALTLFSGQAGASQEKRARLTFYGTDDCADRMGLLAEVESRTSSYLWNDDERASTQVVVRFRQDDRGLAAAIALNKDGSETLTREFSAGTCGELLQGTALVIAVALSSQSPPPTPTSPDKAKPPSTDAGMRIGGGAGGIAIAGLSPEFMIGGEFSFDWVLVGQLWSPLARISLRHALQSGISAIPGRVEFRLDAAALEVCPILLLSSAPVRLRPCLISSFGALTGIGTDFDRNLRATHPWFALGLAIRWEVPLGSLFSVEINGSAEFPVATARFAIDDQVFFSTAPVSGRAEAGVNARF